MSKLIDILLKNSRMRADVFYQGKHCGRWAIPTIVKGEAAFHIISHGECFIKLENQSSYTLKKGDLLFISSGIGHDIQSIDFVSNESEVHSEYKLANDSHSVTTEITCGTFQFDKNIRNFLLDALPPAVIVRADYHSERNWMQSLISLLIAESNHNGVGSDVLVGRLADALFAHIIRCHLSSSSTKVGLYAAHTDCSLRTVLEKMHLNPEKPWNIDDFTKLSNLSRSAFMERFTQTLNESPMAYLGQLRMEMARRLLSEENRQVLDVALSSGYKSEAAFCKAFKRNYGITPGELRHRR